MAGCAARASGALRVGAFQTCIKHARVHVPSLQSHPHTPACHPGQASQYQVEEVPCEAHDRVHAWVFGSHLPAEAHLSQHLLQQRVVVLLQQAPHLHSGVCAVFFAWCLAPSLVYMFRLLPLSALQACPVSS